MLKLTSVWKQRLASCFHLHNIIVVVSALGFGIQSQFCFLYLKFHLKCVGVDVGASRITMNSGLWNGFQVLPYHFYVFLLKYRGPSLWLSVHSHSVARPSCLCFWGCMEKVCTIVSEHGEKSKAACIPSVSCVVVICWVCEAMFQMN